MRLKFRYHHTSSRCIHPDVVFRSNVQVRCDVYSNSRRSSISFGSSLVKVYQRVAKFYNVSKRKWSVYILGERMHEMRFFIGK